MNQKMKRLLFFVYCLLPTAYLTSAQTVLYNGGTDITAEAGSIIYVDGAVINDVNGLIHNKGDIYLTRNWTNYEPSGCLDPTTGTVILDGASTQTITGTEPTTFNNLDCRQGSKKILAIDTYVGGNTGVLMLKSSPFELNSNTLFVTNSSSAAITRTTGYIISETEPAPSGNGYGTVEWRIKNSGAGSNYIYPFGTVAGTYIPFLFNVTNAGVQSTTGAMAVATYPTDVTANPNNRPLPTGVTDLTDISNAVMPEAAPVCVDRFWITNALNYTTDPKADIYFTYTDAEWNTTGSTNNIEEDSLKAWRWGGSQWLQPTVGFGIPNSNQVMVPMANTFSQWTLKGTEPVVIPCGDLFLPNAFSPNGDNKNDIFRPRSNCIKEMTFRIYNRWGNLVFETTDISKGWDGSTPEGKNGNVGVYAYELNATVADDQGVTTQISKKGTVTLLK